jgi:hypothetical protein
LIARIDEIKEKKIQIMKGDIILNNSAWVMKAAKAVKTRDYKSAFDFINENWIQLIRNPKETDDILTSFLILIECYIGDETLPNRYEGEVYNSLLKAFKIGKSSFCCQSIKSTYFTDLNENSINSLSESLIKFLDIMFANSQRHEEVQIPFVCKSKWGNRWVHFSPFRTTVRDVLFNTLNFEPSYLCFRFYSKTIFYLLLIIFNSEYRLDIAKKGKAEKEMVVLAFTMLQDCNQDKYFDTW